MSRFTCSLMQIDGTWVIIRWPEIYKYTKTNGVKFRGHYFDWDFTYIGLTSFESDFTFANGTDMETGVVRSIERPKLYSQETFNYSQNEMLKNANLQELGPLITEYVDANNDLIKEYQLLYWQDGMLNPPIFDPLITLTRFLRIAYYNDPLQNNFGEEKYRFIVITGGGAGSIYTSAATSNDIYLSKGDAFDYSFFISSGYGLSGYAELPMTILFQGVNNNYFYDLWGHWTLYPGYSPLLPFQKIYIQNGEDLVNGLVKELNVLPVPEDGILRLPLVAYPQNGPSDETYFKDFSFSIRSYYEGGSKINGQVHKDFQSKVIKNREEKDIYLDNSPSWYIKGTLYLGTTNVLRDKCKKWTYPGISYPYNSLGIATTQEELYQNYTPRAKYEGNLLYTKIGTGPYQFVNP